MFVPAYNVFALNEIPLIAFFQSEHHSSMYGYSVTSLDFNHDGFNTITLSVHENNLTGLKSVLGNFGIEVRTILTDVNWNPTSDTVGIHNIPFVTINVESMPIK